MLTKKKTRWIGVSVLGVGSIIGLLIAVLYLSPLSYLYCLAREDVWMKATTQRQLEKSLFAFYTKRDISPPESMWGSDHVLNPGQHMTQYLIFGKEPLDVVFFEDGSIDAIYTSYE